MGRPQQPSRPPSPPPPRVQGTNACFFRVLGSENPKPPPRVQGADAWAADRCGNRTALHYAGMHGSPGCAIALLDTNPISSTSRTR
jgi:hypothetical protein